MRKHYTFKELDLYHKDVFFPCGLVTPILGRYLRLAYSKIARERAIKDDVPILDWMTLRTGDVIEIGCIPGTGYPDMPTNVGDYLSTARRIQPEGVDTIVVREPFSATKDILLSIAPDFQKGGAVVKMAWTHTPGRPHFSISKKKYVTKPVNFNPVFAEVA